MAIPLINKLLVLSIVSTVGCALAARACLQSWSAASFSILNITIYGVLTFILAVCGVASWDIQSLSPANSHTVRSLLMEYIFVRLALLIYSPQYKKFTKQNQDVRSIQDRILLEALKFNASTEYGEKYGFSTINGREDYIKKLPLITFASIDHLVERIANGEQNILCTNPVTYLAVTSGTTEKSKRIPMSKRKRPFLMLLALILGTTLKRCPPTLKKVVYLRFKANISHSAAGIKTTTVSQQSAVFLPFYTSPKEAYAISNETVTLYIHAVFALAEEDVTRIEAYSSWLMLSFFWLIEERWRDICDDIERGSLNETLEIEDEIRQRLNAQLKPNHERSEELRREFENGFDRIGLRLWRDLAGAVMTTTGAFAVQAKLLKDSHLKGVEQSSNTHSASEGMMGINVDPQPKDNVVYACTPFYMFYEFIHIDDTDKEHPDTLFLDQVKKGEMYEMVISNLTCLYRYRTSDVIKIVDFLEQCPVYEFQYRLGQLLNMRMEKTTELHLSQAIQQALQELPSDVSLVDYTTAESVVMDQLGIKDERLKPNEKSYVLFVELRQNGEAYNLSEKEHILFDQYLCKANPRYGDTVREGVFQPMTVHCLQKGTFNQLKLTMIASTKTSQYKTPRVLKNQQYLNLLMDTRLKN